MSNRLESTDKSQPSRDKKTGRFLASKKTTLPRKETAKEATRSKATQAPSSASTPTARSRQESRPKALQPVKSVSSAKVKPSPKPKQRSLLSRLLKL